MKILICSLAILMLAWACPAQSAIGSSIEIVTVYSQNGQFFLRSVPFDNEFPTMRGKTSVFRAGNKTPLYEFDRGFDSVDADSNNLILSNDGTTIFYAIPWGAIEDQAGMKSITIYREGKIVRGYTEAEVNGCDAKKERCSLVYSNFDQVIDKARSNLGTPSFKKVLRSGVSETEKFLSDFPIFSFDDVVYLTDSKRKLHRFDLRNGGDLISSDPFDAVFAEIKPRGRSTRTILQVLEAPIHSDFPQLTGGRRTDRALAQSLGLAVHDAFDKKSQAYRFYSFEISGTISRDGRFNIDKLDVGEGLDRDRISAFFTSNRFDISSVPKELDRWYLDHGIFFFHKQDLKLARQEKQQEDLRKRQEYLERQVAETVKGVYIPKDLGECFAELDQQLAEVQRKEMQAKKDRKDMILYHTDLGMWMRNNWGLWGGSRLQKYFVDHGIRHPEEMSSIILYGYYDWLNGKKDSWKAWEKDPKSLSH